MDQNSTLGRHNTLHDVEISEKRDIMLIGNVG